MDYFRQLQHLLPDSALWRPRDAGPAQWKIGDGHTIGEPGLKIGPSDLRPTNTLSRFFRGLVTAPRKAVHFVDRVFEDLFPSSTRELDEWEKAFGLATAANEAARRAQLTGAWAATGGQSPHYLESVVRAAGFPLYLHECWIPGGPPYEPRDPTLVTQRPLIGTAQCGRSRMGTAEARCNAHLMNEPGYLVNVDLSRKAPPPVPDDDELWPFFLYFGSEVYPFPADVPKERRAELEHLIQQIKPAHYWVVMLVNYV